MNVLEFRKWPILPKIMLFSTSGALVFLALTFSILLPFVENQVMEQKRKGLKNSVEAAHSILTHYYEMQADGRMAPHEAQKTASETIRAMRYEGTDYFWINDFTPVMIMHPTRPEFEGKDLADFADPAGNKLFTEFVKVVKQSGMGYVTYMWPKPGGEIPEEKLSFVKGFEPWGWIIGTGVYLDDVEKELSQLHKYLTVGGLGLALTSLVTTWLIGRRLRSRLGNVAKGLKSITQGGIETDIGASLDISQLDEIGELSQQFNELIASMSQLSNFRKVIQDDESVEDIFMRMGELFAKFNAVGGVVIYAIDKTTHAMKAAYPFPFSEEEMFCNAEILENCNLCKAKRSGHTVDSRTFPKACLEFLPDGEKFHFCMPLSISGGTIAIIQFIFDKKQFPAMKAESAHALDKANQYIKEALPVIEAKKLTASLRESSLVDSLTGLNNRRYLQECADHVCAGVKRRKKSVGLLMCDIDFFKEVNDTHGHDAGDEILRQAAGIIAANVRKSDLVFRFGGEEFLVMLVDTEPGDAAEVAEKVRSAFAAHEFVFGKGDRLRKTLSVGVSEFPGDEEAFWKCVKFADVALYEAKSTGRNRVVRFLPSMWMQNSY